MDNASAQCLDVHERLGHITHGEVRQRERIARTTPPLMDADRRDLRTRLPAIPLRTLTNLQLDTEQPAPKTQGALRIVGGELNEGG